MYPSLFTVTLFVFCIMKKKKLILIVNVLCLDLVLCNLNNQRNTSYALVINVSKMKLCTMIRNYMSTVLYETTLKLFLIFYGIEHTITKCKRS